MTYGFKDRGNCDDHRFGVIAKPQETPDYATEHILEFQLVKRFITEINPKDGPKYPSPLEGVTGKVDLCEVLRRYWGNDRLTLSLDGSVEFTPMGLVAQAFPGQKNPYEGEFVLLERGINKAKEGVSDAKAHVLGRSLTLFQMWGTHEINADSTMQGYISKDPLKAMKNLRDVVAAYRYHQDATINDNLKKQSQRIADMFDRLDSRELPGKDFKPWGLNPYKKVGLKSKWESWMRGRAELAERKAVVYLDRYTKDLANAASGLGPKFVQSVAILQTQVNDIHQNPWKNPF